jgi:magnesium transporter
LEAKKTDNQSEIIFHQPDERKVEWYDMRGIHDGKLIELLGKTFKIHPLILEDVSDVNQRPKFEEYETGNFMIIKALGFDEFTQTVTT